MKVADGLTAVLSCLALTTLWGAGSPATGQTNAEDMLPPNAQPGECYARVWVPPTYRTEEVRVLSREASERVEVFPARYEWAEEQVLVREASERTEVVPATYDWTEEKVMVKPAGKRLETVPARYEWVEEKIVDRQAHTVWKKGRNPLQHVKNGTGEIMCLTEVPATYKIVRKRVLKSPATTQEVDVPAEYTMVRKRVVKTPETMRQIQIPAEYKTIRTRKLAEPASEKRSQIPEEYETVTKNILVSDGHMEWRTILCETNMKLGIISNVQRSLKAAGYDPGSIDGVMGSRTQQALDSFQAAKGLARGGLTNETLTALGIASGR